MCGVGDDPEQRHPKTMPKSPLLPFKQVPKQRTSEHLLNGFITAESWIRFLLNGCTRCPSFPPSFLHPSPPVFRRLCASPSPRLGPTIYVPGRKPLVASGSRTEVTTANYFNMLNRRVWKYTRILPVRVESNSFQNVSPSNCTLCTRDIPFKHTQVHNQDPPFVAAIRPTSTYNILIVGFVSSTPQ